METVRPSAEKSLINIERKTNLVGKDIQEGGYSEKYYILLHGNLIYSKIKLFRFILSLSRSRKCLLSKKGQNTMISFNDKK